MANLPQVGLEAVIAGMPQFNAAAGQITKAFDGINSKSSSIAKSVSGDFVNLGNSVLKFGTIAGGVALAGVTALGAGIAAFATTGIEKAIDLDAQMATIAATMNTTKDAVGPLKDLILDLALDPSLTVNTTQAADAIQLLAQNGATANEIIGGLAASTVALANATGAQFSTAADVASGVMKVFNLEANEMGIAIDGITGVVNQSKFTIDDYAQAFAQAGGVAANLGVSLEDFNTVIAATSTSFNSGSDAGTSFKTLLQRLSNPTDEARTAMEKYGISLFDAEGNMRPLAEVAGQLNNVFQGTATITEVVGGATDKMAKAAENAQEKIPQLTIAIEQQQKKLQIMKDELGAIILHYGEGSLRAQKQKLAIENLTLAISDNENKLSGYKKAITDVDTAQAKTITSTVELTEAQKAELAAVIGGADAARIVLALSQTTADEFDNLSGSVNDVGQAFRSAATRVDSVKGAFEIFQGIIEAIQIQVGDKFLPILRRLTVWFTDMASKFAPRVVSMFGEVAGVIDRFISKVSGLMTIFQAGGLFGSRSGSFGSVGLLAALGISPDIIDVIQGIFTQITTLVSSFISGGVFGGVALAGGDVARTGGILKALGFSDEAITTLQSFVMQITEIISQISFSEILGGLTGIGAVLATGVFAALVAGLFALLTPINLIIAGAALLGAAWVGNWGGIQEKTFAVWAVVQPILMQLGQWLSVNLPVAIQFLSEAWNNVLFPALTAIWEFVSGTLFPLWLELQTWLMTNIPVAIQTLSDFWTNTLLPAITGVWDFVSTKLFPLWLSIQNLLIAVGSKGVEVLAAQWRNILLPALRSVWDFISKSVTPLFNELFEFIAENLSPQITDFSENVLPILTEGLEFVSDAIKDLTGFFNSLTDAVNNFVVPPQLLGQSPPPFADSLMFIAQAAQEATKGIVDFNSALGQGGFDQLLGIDRSIVQPLNVAGQAFDDLEKRLEGLMGHGKGAVALDLIKKIIKPNLTAIMAAANPGNFIQDLLKASGVNFERMGLTGLFGEKGGIGGEFWMDFTRHMEEAQAQLQEMFIEAGRTAITIGQRLTGVIGGAVDMLNSRVERLQGLVAAGGGQFEGRILDAVQAQQLLNEALEEQAAIQDDILATKENEQKLNFLQQQLDLFDTIRQAGLDVGDVLGGLTLGLDASIPDLIAATNAVIEAMINQVNADLGTITGVGAAIGDALVGGVTDSLGIGSPSRVMRALADNTMGSFLSQMMAWGPAIASAGSAAIAGPSLVAAPAIAGGGGNQTTIHANFGNNSISSGMDEAQFDSMVLRSIQRLMR